VSDPAVVSDPAGAIAWGKLVIASGLIVVAAALLLLEILVVSWGMLALCAGAAAFAACALAWQVSPLAGWAFFALCPIVAVLVVRTGLRRLAASRLVPKAEITAEAGYHHAAARVGATPGAVGELVTDALPTGRARFPGGEADVQIEGAGLPRGSRVVVLRVNGPTVIVAAAKTEGMKTA
jgi:membrane-bound ClpP family serine protease